MGISVSIQFSEDGRVFVLKVVPQNTSLELDVTMTMTMTMTDEAVQFDLAMTMNDDDGRTEDMEVD
jgi:hypothetical protein